jgi:hypothetical protein
MINKILLLLVYAESKFRPDYAQEWWENNGSANKNYKNVFLHFACKGNVPAVTLKITHGAQFENHWNSPSTLATSRLP